MTGFDRLVDRLCATLKAHLDGARPRVPEEAAPLWRAFVELHRGRAYADGLPQPLSWTDIGAWARLERWPLERRHIDAIRRLDDAWLSHGRAPAPAPRAGVTPALFDALFSNG